jgi:hypothetical protein
MAVNKTLYVKDEDAPVWDKARELVGDKLSLFLTNHLKVFVAQKEASLRGFQRIVLQFTYKGLPRAMAFNGRWLIPPAKPFVAKMDNGGDDNYAVAITGKSNVVVFNFIGTETTSGYCWGNLISFGSFEEASRNEAFPDHLIEEAMKIHGIEIEELDI